MAVIELTYKSRALKMNVAVTVILPENTKTNDVAGAPRDTTFKTVYLYHGVGANHSDWIRKTNIERYAAERKIAVVMPEVGRTWYADTVYDLKYFTFITQELPAVCQSYFKCMTDRREDNMVAGFSMGGYGAVKAALRCPEKFCACASLSGALDITRDGRSYILEEWQSLFGYNLKDAAELRGSEHDIFALTQRNKEAKLPFPSLYLWCGTEDTLIDINRKYHQLLDSLDIPHLYEESEGTHTWKWWDLYIQRALDHMLKLL